MEHQYHCFHKGKATFGFNEQSTTMPQKINFLAKSKPEKPRWGSVQVQAIIRPIACSLLFVLCFGACKLYTITEEGNFRPKRAKFKLKDEFVLDDLTRQIDTTCIYVSHDFTKFMPDSSISFIRFFNDGHVYLNSYTPKDNKEIAINDVSHPYIGYYASKNGKLLIELFGVYYNGSGNYAIYECELRNSDIVFLKETLRSGATTRRVEIYKKEPAILSIIKPDW